MFGASRYFYNKTVAYIKETRAYPNRMSLQKKLMRDVPKWAEGVPYKVKQMAIDDACKAHLAVIEKYRREKIFSTVHFRRKKDRCDSIYIPKQLIDGSGFYKRSLGDMFYSEEIKEVVCDCRVVFKRGYYFITVPYDKKVKRPENQRMKFVSLDPGIRTFQTLFTPYFSIKAGCGDFKEVYRCCLSLDSLISQRKKSRSVKLNRSIDRLRWRLKNKVDELHNKLSVSLCKSFDNIIIPRFSATKMTNKLRSKTARSLLSWAHSSFRNKLILKAEEYNCNVILVNEAYTSKTCSYCGKIHKIGSKKVMRCSCGRISDRDINGARGIFLLAMIDPSLLEIISNS